MAYNEALTNRIREALELVPDVVEKKMFRGVTFMVDGKMCVTASDRGMMCRIDPAVHAEAVEHNGCSTIIMKGRELIGYIRVEEEVLKTKKDLNYWISLALDFNKRAKATPKKKKK